MKPLLLMLVASPAFAQLAPVATANETPWWVWPAVAIAVAGGAFLLLRKRNPAAAASIQGAASNAVDSAMALLHKQADTHAEVVATNSQLAAVVVSEPVQAVVNAPAPLSTTVTVLPGATRPAPVAKAAVNDASNNYGVPAEYISPLDPNYIRQGNEPPMGWQTVLRTQMFGSAGRVDKGDPNYHEGDAPGKRATDEQMALIRTTYDSALSENVRTTARLELIASLGFPGDNGDAGSPGGRALAALLAANPLNG